MSLERLPDDAAPEEKAVLEQLYRNYQDRGTLLTMAESLYGEQPMVKPSAIPSKFVNLRELDETGDIYVAVLGFAQAKWPDRNFSSFYGTFKSKWQSDRYALMSTNNDRCPVKLLWHFQIEVPDQGPEICSLVSRLDMDDVPLLPWSLYAEDLGYYVTRDNSFGPIEAVPPDRLVSPVVTAPFDMRSSAERLRIVIAYDRTGSEIFEEGNVNGDGGDAME
ncbi:hypothetical protein RSAG8_09486, partial [Rhizoctonia solani AG-8 WAC10335]